MGVAAWLWAHDCGHAKARQVVGSERHHITSFTCTRFIAQIDIRVFVDMPEANETTEGSVPNYVGLMTWLHDHMTMRGESAALMGGRTCCRHAPQCLAASLHCLLRHTCSASLLPHAC